MIQATLRRDVMGIGIDCVTEDDVVDHVLDSLAEGRGGRIVTPNVDILRQLVHHAELRPLVQRADLIIADGAPVVWASRLQGTPLPERIAGATMMWHLSAAAATSGLKVLLLGAAPAVAARAATRLRAATPGLECDCYSPPFGFQHSCLAVEEIVRQVSESRPDIVFCGFGFPTQERLMARLCELFPATWFCGVGAAIDFAAGELTRAPELMQRLGLEWLHRLAHEPRRLFVRYVVRDLPFALLLLGNAARRRIEIL